MKDEWKDGVTRSALRVIEAIATSPPSDRELWRYLFAVDSVQRIEAWHVPIDHPLFLVVTEPRRLHPRVGDGLWVRIVDLERALAACSYAADGAVTFDLTDSFLPANAGVWRLEASRGQAVVSRSGGELSSARIAADLGSAYLGGFTFTQLERAGHGSPGLDGQHAPTTSSGRGSRPGAPRSSRGCSAASFFSSSPVVDASPAGACGKSAVRSRSMGAFRDRETGAKSAIVSSPGRLAQLGEHQLDKLGVTGSSPVPPIRPRCPCGNPHSSMIRRAGRP